jgi:elongation factor Ts
MAEISAKLVKELRDKTGAGMMDCKKALTESGGDTTKATEWLRQKGIATAEKKSGRTAAEGAIGSYIHTGARVGVLVEVNCETDFVARGDLFQDLLRNVAMQIAACPNVEFVSTADIPKDVADREKSIEMGRDDLAGKPEAMKVKIVEGRIGKRLKELALLEQPFIKDSPSPWRSWSSRWQARSARTFRSVASPATPWVKALRWRKAISLPKSPP